MASRGESPPAEPGDVTAPPARGLGRRVALGVILGLAIYAGFALWADLDGLGEALAAIPWWAPVAACALSLTNYAVRFPRWQRYLVLSGSTVRGWTSVRIYLAGLALTVSPGKVGEAMKSWLIRDADGTPIATTAPIVLAERLTDLLGFLVLIGLTSTTGEHTWIALVTLGLAAMLLALVGSKTFAHTSIGLVARLPGVRSHAAKIEEMLDSSRRLLAPRELPLATALAALGWFCECVGCWILVQSVLPHDAAGTPELGLAAVTYAFAVSAVAGAVVVITPAGLGVTEGVLAGLLAGGYRAAGFAAASARATALSATLVTRLCTLWFAMFVGLVTLQIHRRIRGRAAAADS